MKKLGFKVDNCPSKENLFYLNSILNQLNNSQPIEIGLECYENPRHFNKKSEFIDLFSEKTINHLNKIVHLTLEAKILNISALSQKDWLNIWNDQLKAVNKLNPKYLIVHATSKESKIFSVEDQIINICINSLNIETIFDRPLFIENTYEDLMFYENLFEIAPISMNFAFDIGHMKVHSKRTTDDWINFLLKLKNEGRKIHFHIHDNNGIYDQHKTLSEINDPIMINFILKLINLFPEFNFILESHSTDFDKIYQDYLLLSN